MDNKNTKVLTAATLLSCVISAHAFADIQILGSESEISQSITDHYQQSSQYYNGSLAKNDALYINVATASDDDINKAKSHIYQGDTATVALAKATVEFSSQ